MVQFIGYVSAGIHGVLSRFSFSAKIQPSGRRFDQLWKGLRSFQIIDSNLVLSALLMIELTISLARFAPDRQKCFYLEGQ
jgi:hypothetical protein